MKEDFETSENPFPETFLLVGIIPERSRCTLAIATTHFLDSVHDSSAPPPYIKIKGIEAQ